MSFLVRSTAADYGFQLNEFDPFFNYRATEYIVNNGISSYFEWNDELSWYPHGRDVSATSQVMLHLTAASTYWIFAGNSSLYDFTIIFPVVFASFSAIVIFALVRVLAGTTAGLIASLLYSISLPLIIRSPIGWFKSEPLGIFFGLLCIHFLLSGLNSTNKKVAIAKIIASGVFTTFAISSWGGNQFFIIPVGIFFIILPFLRTDHKFLLWSIPLYTITTLISSIPFERGISFTSLGGIVLVISSIFLILCVIIQRTSDKNKTRNGLILLFSFIIIGSGIFVLNSNSEILPLPSHRYMNALNPFLTTTDPLVDSVSEHATTTIEQSFLFHSILMLFGGFGVWVLIKNIQNKKSYQIKNEMLAFALIFGLIGIYVSSTFVRLEVFASLSLIILSSIGISLLIKELYNNQNKNRPTKIIKIPFLIGIIFLLTIPLIYPAGSDTLSLSKVPPTILNGGTAFTTLSTNDWIDALEWIKNNTPEDAVVASWWDYGYWIQTLGERATLADNSTVNTKIIQNIARMLLSNPDDSWHQLKQMQADYVLIFVASNKLNFDTPQEFFTLNGGGEESKKQWFMRISGIPESKFVHSDGASGKDFFWNETLLGQMIPYSVLGYVNPNNVQQQSPTYVPGMIAVYEKDVKFSQDQDGPLKLVYSSPSYRDGSTGPKLNILIYEINPDYVPDS